MITVALTMVDGSMTIYENVHKAGPNGSFFLIGLEDKTVVIPESQVKVICTTSQEGETK